MPPLILIAAGVLGGAALVRLAVREGKRINRELDRIRKTEPAARDVVPTLRRDPDSGTYRPG